jgi:mannose-1-phosphate guanylyltransferase
MLKAMILAAGVGSRLDPITTETPKPLVPVANVPVMGHILDLLRKHGLHEACANLHYLPEKIERYFQVLNTEHLSLQLKREEKLSGDAGGVRACRSFLQDDTFIVLSGDLLTDANLTEVIEAHKKRKAMASIAVKPVDDVTQFGVAVVNREGYITGFQEKPSKAEALSNLVSTGIYILEPEIFNHIPASGEFGFGRQLFPTLVKQGVPVAGIEIDDYWSDVGTIDQYRQANFDVLSGKAKFTPHGKQVKAADHTVWLEAGAQIEDMNSIAGDLVLGKNSVVKKGAQIRGKVVIGDNCTIQPGAIVTNSVIWWDNEIGKDAEIENCVICSGCVVPAKQKMLNLATTALTFAASQTVPKR